MKTFEKNPHRAAAVKDIIYTFSRRTHHGLDDQQRLFVAHALRYYGQGRTGKPESITADTVAGYSVEYVLKTLLLARPNMNTEGLRVIGHILNKIEVTQEVLWACQGAGELPVVSPYHLTLRGRIRIHALIRAVKDVGESMLTTASPKNSPCHALATWAILEFRTDSPLAAPCLRQALRTAELFGPTATGNGFERFPDGACEVYWPELTITEWKTQ